MAAIGLDTASIVAGVGVDGSCVWKFGRPPIDTGGDGADGVVARIFV
jgi:hypothetical protein